MSYFTSVVTCWWKVSVGVETAWIGTTSPSISYVPIPVRRVGRACAHETYELMSLGLHRKQLLKHCKYQWAKMITSDHVARMRLLPIIKKQNKFLNIHFETYTAEISTI